MGESRAAAPRADAAPLHQGRPVAPRELLEAMGDPEGGDRILAPMAEAVDQLQHLPLAGGIQQSRRFIHQQQARALGLEHRWPEVAERYAEVNRLFGDIVKVTPTSKVVGDMALFMVVNDLTVADVLDPEREIAFPESVVSLFRGELGFPPDGFPRAISRREPPSSMNLHVDPGANDSAWAMASCPTTSPKA